MHAKWMVFDAQGRRYQPPQPKLIDGYYSCDEGRDGSRFGTPNRAILWWALFRASLDIAEIVPPFHRSMRERCQRTVDTLWERVRLMGEAEGGNGTGGTVEFVIDDAGAVEEQAWTSDECDFALDGIALALSALKQMSDGVDPEPEGL